MRLEELMTTDVITIGPEATLKEAARRMIEARISGLPVTDETGALIGVITEADFVKEEAGRRSTKRARLLRWFHKEEPLDAERLVGDVMTQEVFTLDESADHADAARLMQAKNIKRIPVVTAEGRLLGVVSRSDILRAFARSDAEIIDEVTERVMRHILWIDPKRVALTSLDGNVVLRGQLETKSDAHLLVELVDRIDGVVSVTDQLTWEVDNTKTPIVSQPPVGRNW
ncbi:MAG: CBS domain-containing protein [Acidimicrobiia bacterium]